VMFKAADLVLLTKCDLVPHLDVDLAKLHDALARVMPRPRVLELSARTGAGIDAWIAWLADLRGTLRRTDGRLAGGPHEHVHDHGHGHGHEHEHGHGHGHEHEHADGTRHVHR